MPRRFPRPLGTGVRRGVVTPPYGAFWRCPAMGRAIRHTWGAVRLIFGSQNIPAGRFPADAGVGPFLPCREVPAFPLPSGRDGWAGVSRTAAPPMIRRKVYVCDPWLLDLLALRLADASLLRAHRLLRRGPDPLYAGGEAGAAALHDEEQAQHDPHEHGLRPAAGDPEALRQQPREDGGGAAAALSGERHQPHERLPVELHPHAHPHRPLLHHPPAHHPLHDAEQGGLPVPGGEGHRRRHRHERHPHL